MKRSAIGMLSAIALALSVSACTIPGESASSTVDDAAITTAVKSRLTTDPMALATVDVNTVRGTVYLTGTVRDGSAKLRAQEIAMQVEGVSNVVNDLKKTTSSTAGDGPEYLR